MQLEKFLKRLDEEADSKTIIKKTLTKGKVSNGLLATADYKDGTHKEWHSNGIVRIESHKKNGKLHGSFKQWDKRGKFIKKAEYKDGKLISLDEIKDSKNRESFKKWDQTDIDGEWLEHYENLIKAGKPPIEKPGD